MSAGNYFEVDGPLRVKAGDYLTVESSGEVWRVTSIRRLSSGRFRCRFVLTSLEPAEEDVIKFAPGLLEIVHE